MMEREYRTQRMLRIGTFNMANLRPEKSSIFAGLPRGPRWWALVENVAVKSFLIADDHEIVRTGLREIIEARSGWIVSGEAADGLQAIDLAYAKSPDIMIVDYSMPFLNGVEVCRRIRSHGLATQILFLTVHESEDILTQAVSAGARGVLLKSDARKHLISAIETLLAGEPYLTSVLLEKLLHNYQLNKQNSTNSVLTSREQSVVKLVAEGHSNRVIGAMLELSIKTVETHRAAAMRKLGLSSTAELVRYAIREKLILP
jgi:DNA-binding NarL/FixJ family response regulator